MTLPSLQVKHRAQFKGHWGSQGHSWRSQSLFLDKIPSTGSQGYRNVNCVFLGNAHVKLGGFSKCTCKNLTNNHKKVETVLKICFLFASYIKLYLPITPHILYAVIFSEEVKSSSEVPLHTQSFKIFK